MLPAADAATIRHAITADTLAGIETSSITSDVTVEFDRSMEARARGRESSLACTPQISTRSNHLHGRFSSIPRVPAKQLDEGSALRGIHATTRGRDDELA